MYNFFVCVFCVAYFKGEASKSVHIRSFLNTFYMNYPIPTKFLEIVWRLLSLRFEFDFYQFMEAKEGVAKI